MPSARAIWILAALVLVVGAGWALAQSGLLSWETLASHQAAWRGWAAGQPALAALAYVAVYSVVVGASVPAGGLLSVAGGVLFGAFTGAALAVLGASLGAVGLFLLARGTLGRLLAPRARPFLDRVRPTLERDGFWGLLALRLIPVVPFWLGNLAPALLGIRLLPFAAATVIGIIPATAVLAGLGAGLGDAVTSGRPPDLAVLFAPEVLLPILALAALSMLPIALRRWRARHGTA